jgi:hypothetical protein
MMKQGKIINNAYRSNLQIKIYKILLENSIKLKMISRSI